MVRFEGDTPESGEPALFELEGATGMVNTLEVSGIAIEQIKDFCAKFLQNEVPLLSKSGFKVLPVLTALQDDESGHRMNHSRLDPGIMLVAARSFFLRNFSVEKDGEDCFIFMQSTLGTEKYAESNKAMVGWD